MKHVDCFDFNKQIILGEMGALIGIQLFLFIGGFFYTEPAMLSWFAVIGSLIGAAGFWLGTRIFDENRKNRLSKKNMASDIAYYTPAAVIIVIVFYLPLLKFLTQTFLEQGWFSSISGIVAQVLAFIAFLVLINLYRLALMKWFKKRL